MAVLSAGARIAHALESIATSLAVLAADVTVKRQAEHIAIQRQYEHLKSELDTAERRFEMSDTRVMNLGREADEISRQWNQRNENALSSADEALRAFVAAHPVLGE